MCIFLAFILSFNFSLVLVCSAYLTDLFEFSFFNGFRFAFYVTFVFLVKMGSRMNIPHAFMFGMVSTTIELGFSFCIGNV